MITACWFCGGGLRTDRDVLVFSRWVPLCVVVFLSCVDCGTGYLEQRDEAGAAIGPAHDLGPPPTRARRRRGAEAELEADGADELEDTPPARASSRRARSRPAAELTQGRLFP